MDARCYSILFGGSSHALSNFYGFDMWFDGRLLPSLEHHYQLQKLMYHTDDPALLNRVIYARTPRDAMQIARHLFPEGCLNCAWMDQRVAVMQALLDAKFQQCPPFRDALACHGHFIEDTNNTFWARGKDWKGLNQLGQSMHHLRQSCFPHLVLIGDSSIREMPHTVQLSTPLEGCSSSYVEYGRISIGESYMLTTVVCNPGITTQGLIRRVEKFPYLIDQASHVACITGTNDISSGLPPFEIQNQTKKLHTLINFLNPGAKIFDLCVFPRRDHFDKLVVELNKFKTQSPDACIPHKLRRKSLPIQNFYHDQIHLSSEGKIKVWSTIVDKVAMFM